MLKKIRSRAIQILCLALSAAMLLPMLIACAGDDVSDNGISSDTDTESAENTDAVSESEAEAEKETEPVTEAVTEKVIEAPTFSEADGYTVIENSYISCRTNGEEIILVNKATSREIPLSMPKITAQLTVANIWQTDASKAKEIKFENPVITNEEGCLIVAAEQDGITLKTKFLLENNEIRLSAEIANNSTGVAIGSEFPTVDLSALSDCSIMWPEKEGELHDSLDTITATGVKTVNYPATMSMQLVTLFTDDETFYYYCADDEFIHKTFRCTKKKLSVTQYPFVARGETKTTADIVIGFAGGGWEAGSDVYRTWLIDAIGGKREQCELAANVVGWNGIHISTYPRKINVPYTNVPGKETSLRNETGADMTILFGWHKDGFDSRYPEYEYYEDLGGEEAFADAIAKIHKNGGYAIPYTNAHIADTKSTWYTKNGKTNAIKKADGSFYYEDYGTGLTYVAMCPSAKGFQDAFVAAAERTRRVGADGLWIDQLMAMPSYLCYNEDHGHTTPATAYYSGYTALLTRVDEVMAQYGDEWFYCCEGVCDAYAAYIDICGPVWSHKYGQTEQVCPEVTRYTIPMDILGLRQVNTKSGCNYFGRAFLMANPLLSGDSPKDSLTITKIYRKYPELLLQGEYLGEFMTFEYEKGTLYSSLIGTDKKAGDTILDRIVGDTVSIQLFYDMPNLKSSPDAEETFDLGREIESAVDAETGKECTVSGTTVTVTIEPGKVKSVICKFK